MGKQNLLKKLFQSEHSKKLELIDFTRRYSIEILGFNSGHAFETESGNVYEYYVVSWSPRAELKLQNEFYVSKTAAIEKRNELSADYDMFVRALDAYGGHGDCPITRAMLERPEHEIAYDVVHEKWHDKVAGFSILESNLLIEEAAGDALGFNESIKIMKLLYGEGSREHIDAIKFKEHQLKRAKIVKEFAEDLDALYRSGMSRFEILSEKKRMLDDFNLSYENVVMNKVEGNAMLGALYTYDALALLADDIYMRHNFRAKEIFIGAMKTAKFMGVEAGVDELLKYSSLDKKDYKRVVNIYMK